jgi:hypothetical protein
MRLRQVPGERLGVPALLGGLALSLGPWPSQGHGGDWGGTQSRSCTEQRSAEMTKSSKVGLQSTVRPGRNSPRTPRSTFVFLLSESGFVLVEKPESINFVSSSAVTERDHMTPSFTTSSTFILSSCHGNTSCYDITLLRGHRLILEA